MIMHVGTLQRAGKGRIKVRLRTSTHMRRVICEIILKNLKLAVPVTTDTALRRSWQKDQRVQVLYQKPTFGVISDHFAVLMQTELVRLCEILIKYERSSWCELDLLASPRSILWLCFELSNPVMRSVGKLIWGYEWSSQSFMEFEKGVRTVGVVLHGEDRVPSTPTP